MGTNSVSDTDSLNTDARIDTKSLSAARPNDSANAVPSIPAGSTNERLNQSGFFDLESDGEGDDLGGFVSDVATIAQSRCEHCEDYATVETLICHLPVDHLTFAGHDSLAPYSGPYPMTLLVRAFIIKEINGWDETALHDHLRARPSLRQDLGFESLPNQSTFWRAWNHRFSEDLRDTVQGTLTTIRSRGRMSVERSLTRSPTS